MGSLLLLFRFFLSLPFFLVFHFASFSSFSSSLQHSLTSAVPLCHPAESSSLLHFKNSLFSITHDDYDDYEYYHDECPNSYPKTTTWENGTDCCSWLGVTCHPVSGHVTGLDLSCSGLQGELSPNSTLFHLTHLQRLNLAHNHLSASHHLPSPFGAFVSLTHLNLSHCHFEGNIPSQISYLSKLVSLDLSINSGLELKEATTWKRLLHNATLLREILMDGVDMSSITPNPLSILANRSCSSLVSLSLAHTGLVGTLTSDTLCLPNLQELYLRDNEGFQADPPILNCSSCLNILDLSSCQFQGSIPSSLSNLSHLTSLTLTSSNLNASIPSFLSNLRHLTHLDLSWNQLSGQIPDMFGNLTKLQFLKLGGNYLQGRLPSSLFTLTQLSFLDCSSNNFEGSLPSQITGFSNLTHLDLNGNSLSGTFPSWCLLLPSLTYLDLSNNQLTGQISSISSYSLTNLQLCGIRLQGNIPESLFNLVNLTCLCLTSYNRSSSVNLSLFLKLQNLQFLSLSEFNLLLPSSESNVAYNFTKLRFLKLRSNNIVNISKISGNFPNLKSLDLSNNKLKGNVPNWIHGLESLINLNLSKNQLTSMGRFPWYNLQYLDLSSNLMSEDISSFICNATDLTVINLSQNKFTGTVPQCLDHFRDLYVLDLHMNKLHGTLSNSFSMNKHLSTLNLYGNQLEGPLPKSLSNCTTLEVLNLGENQIKDTFPHWLQNLSFLTVLVLRANKLYGPIVDLETKHVIFALTIFDISCNNFSGPLPKAYLQKFEVMKSVARVEYQTSLLYINLQFNPYIGGADSIRLEEFVPEYDNSLSATTKGTIANYVRIPTILAIIDLSGNKFEGEIPDVIGELHGLNGLNLSHNRLTGSIPLSMRNLTNLEWLDLSSNMLTGEIPTELTNLNFLEVLNVSNNHLVGAIPQGKQFNTFSNDSYQGNMGLCGLPLSIQCKKDPRQQSPPSPANFEIEDKFGFGWKPVAIGYACGMVFGVALGCCVLWTGKPQCLVRLVRAVPKKRVRIRSRGNRARIN